MMGLYPDCPGEPYYTITTPTFDSVEIDTQHGTITIECQGEGDYIDAVKLGNKTINRYRIPHDELIKGKILKLKLR